MTLAPVLRAARVGRSREATFRLFTDEIGVWWPLGTHGVFGAESGGVAFVDGLLVERATDGREAVWAEVLAWDPPTHLALAWHAGHDAARASRLDVHFHDDEGDATRVEIVHHGWESLGEEADTGRQRYAGPRAWGMMLDQFVDVADRTAIPDPPSELAAAYDAFFTEAAAGGFGSPPPGEWTAAQVIAHVAVNDDAIAAVCRGLFDGGQPTFANLIANDTAVLDRFVARCGGGADGAPLAGLLGAGRERARVVCTLLGRLGPDALAHAVPSHLVDGGRLVVDQPLPWGALAIDTQAGYHLPAHTDQLRHLRPA